MKNLIYYFTGTGNSYTLAESIASKIGDCELVAIKSYEKVKIKGNYRKIGFVFPVYIAGLPAIVNNFLKNLEIENSKNTYIFAIATCGQNAGISIAQVNKILRSKGISLDYGDKITMFANCVTLYDMKKNVQQITNNSNLKARAISSNINNEVKNNSKKVNVVINAIYSYFIKRINNGDKHFNVDDKCNSCGICKDVCAVKNIKMENNKPVFNHKCQHCLACIHYCPSKAINYKNKTQKRRRYNHPQVDYIKMTKIRKI